MGTSLNPGKKEGADFTLKQFLESCGIVGILMIWFEILDCHDLSKLTVAGGSL
jgi:hypothetical protein